MNLIKSSLKTSYINHRAFKDCRRLWLYRYAPEAIVTGDALWEVIRQGRLLPATALLGRVVDDVITAALRFRQNNGRWPRNPAAAIQKVTDDYISFTRQWKTAVSSRGKWPCRSGKQPIDRIYFGEEFNVDEIQALITRGEDYIDRWFNLALIAELDQLNTFAWKVPVSSVTPHFMLGEIKVYAKFDFMIVEPGRVRIYDWKTGNLPRGEQAARIQLHGYAVYAHQVIPIPFELIELSSVWLGANCTFKESVDIELVESVQQGWISQVAEVSRSLGRVNGGQAKAAEVFPMTEHSWICKGCAFRTCQRNPNNPAPRAS